MSLADEEEDSAATDEAVLRHVPGNVVKGIATVVLQHMQISVPDEVVHALQVTATGAFRGGMHGICPWRTCLQGVGRVAPHHMHGACAPRLASPAAVLTTGSADSPPPPPPPPLPPPLPSPLRLDGATLSACQTLYAK
jgi:hypothetical protein